MSSSQTTAGSRPPPLTPQKSAASAAAAATSTDSPGNWSHPRLAEITRRKNATVFTDKNVRVVVYNVLALAIVLAVRSSSWVHRQTMRYSPSTRQYIGWAYLTAQLIALINIAVALLPLFRNPDPVEDIPLTAAQRRLLGLPPSSAPPTPGSAFSTPPRYSRTPSISGSAISAKSFGGGGTSSPLSGKGGSPAAGAPAQQPFDSPSRRPNASPFSPGSGGGGGSPLLHKAMNGRKSSFGGSPGPLLGGGSIAGSGLFADSTTANNGAGMGTPSPAGGGKRTSVGLNSKWLYEKGRRSSGSAWVQ